MRLLGQRITRSIVALALIGGFVGTATATLFAATTPTGAAAVTPAARPPPVASRVAHFLLAARSSVSRSHPTTVAIGSSIAQGKSPRVVMQRGMASQPA